MGRRKTIQDIWLLQFMNTADGMISLVSLTALTTEKLHVLYVTGMKNTSVLKRGNMAVAAQAKF
jgi:hypothetical protein